jgi:hypothetical protein
MRALINFHYGGPRAAPVGSTTVTVYDGAVRIQGKDGKELQPWRIVVYQQGVGIRYTTVPAPNGVEAADRARRRWPNGTVITL